MIVEGIYRITTLTSTLTEDLVVFLFSCTIRSFFHFPLVVLKPLYTVHNVDSFKNRFALRTCVAY